MNTCLKIAVVVVISGLAGLVGHSALTSAAPAAKANTKSRQEAIAGSSTHCRLTLDNTNYGGKGELGLHFDFAVENPDDPTLVDHGRAQAQPLDVIVSATDLTGNSILEPTKVGQVVDELGKGFWKKEFDVKFPFLPGEYLVHVDAVHPTIKAKDQQGKEVGPWGMCGMAHVMTVN